MDDQSLPRPLLSGSNLLSSTETLFKGLRYRPRTQATQTTFNYILAIVAKKLGVLSLEVVYSAADVTLEHLKDEDLKDFEKKEEIDDILGACLSLKEFNELVDLGKQITDYDVED
jgi:pre-mRNA-splicing helicase BRR2